jgi:hypothetical protein
MLTSMLALAVPGMRGPSGRPEAEEMEEEEGCEMLREVMEGRWEVVERDPA